MANGQGCWGCSVGGFLRRCKRTLRRLAVGDTAGWQPALRHCFKMNWDAIIDNGLKIVAVFALVLLNGFFVAAELALVRVRDTQLAALVAKGNRRAKIAREIIGNIDGYIG